MERPIPVVTRSAAPPVVVRSAAPMQTASVSPVPMTAGSGNGQITIINNVNPTPVVTPQVFGADDFPVPGFGFDFAHLAAVNAGRHTGLPGRTFVTTPFFGVPLFTGFSSAVPIQAAPPQVIVIQQPVPQQVEDGDAEVIPRRSRRAYSEPAPEAPAASAPLRDAGEYVIVKRDGGLLFAVAFTVQDGQLTYITREGLPRTVGLAAIDRDATAQMNQQRGMTVRLPA